MLTTLVTVTESLDEESQSGFVEEQTRAKRLEGQCRKDQTYVFRIRCPRDQDQFHQILLWRLWVWSWCEFDPMYVLYEMGGYKRLFRLQAVVSFLCKKVLTKGGTNHMPEKISTGSDEFETAANPNYCYLGDGLCQAGGWAYML